MGDNSDPKENGVPSGSSVSDLENGMGHETSVASAQNGIGLIDIGQTAHGDEARTEDVNGHPKTSPTVARRADEYEVDFSYVSDVAN